MGLNNEFMKFFHFSGELYDQDADRLQIKVIKYVCIYFIMEKHNYIFLAVYLYLKKYIDCL